MKKRLLYIINVDWYFFLHWLPRAKAAQKNGFEVHVATQCTSDDFVNKFLQEEFYLHKITLVRKSINPLREWCSKIEISKAVSTIKPDLVHSITVKPNLYAGLICKKLNIPLVMSITGLGMAFSSDKFRAVLARKIISSIYRHSLLGNGNVQLIFENKDDKELFVQTKIANNNQVNVIAGAGVDLEEYPYAPKLKHDNQRFKILFAARMLWDKGLLDLIEAVKILKKSSQVDLLVAGILDVDNVDAISINQINRWHEEGVIKWLGEVKSGMPDLISESDVVVLPTRYGEGVPRILIEAAAIGRPIITTNVSGCRDIVQDEINGFLIPIGDVKYLLRCLLRLYNDYNLCVNMGGKGRMLAETTFSQRIVINKMISIYFNIINKAIDKWN